MSEMREMSRAGGGKLPTDAKVCDLNTLTPGFANPTFFPDPMEWVSPALRHLLIFGSPFNLAEVGTAIIAKMDLDGS